MPDRFCYCPCCTAPLAWGEHGGLERLACTRCDYVRWDNPIPVVAAIVEHEGQIVLARNALWPPGMFALITGFMEKSDASPESAALREVEEELNLKGEIAGFVGHYRFPRMNQIILAYHVRASGQITLDPELVEYRREPPESLRPWPGATGDALRDWMLACGLQPQPYNFEPLQHIPAYRRIGAGVAAGGQPAPVQFFALGLARTQAVIALGPEREEDRRAAENVGMRYLALGIDTAAPGAAGINALAAAMAPLQGQHVYIYADNEAAATVLSAAYCVKNLGVAPATARRALRAQGGASGVQASTWLAFAERQFTEMGSLI